MMVSENDIIPETTEIVSIGDVHKGVQSLVDIDRANEIFDSLALVKAQAENDVFSQDDRTAVRKIRANVNKVVTGSNTKKARALIEQKLIEAAGWGDAIDASLRVITDINREAQTTLKAIDEATKRLDDEFTEQRQESLKEAARLFYYNEGIEGDENLLIDPTMLRRTTEYSTAENTILERILDAKRLGKFMKTKTFDEAVRLLRENAWSLDLAKAKLVTKDIDEAEESQRVHVSRVDNFIILDVDGNTLRFDASLADDVVKAVQLAANS